MAEPQAQHGVSMARTKEADARLNARSQRQSGCRSQTLLRLPPCRRFLAFINASIYNVDSHPPGGVIVHQRVCDQPFDMGVCVGRRLPISSQGPLTIRFAQVIFGELHEAVWLKDDVTFLNVNQRVLC